jgi:16S rRNA (cytosine1402-N4)-methyltransferase
MWAEVEDNPRQQDTDVVTHVSVLRDEAVSCLAPQPGSVVVDVTVGAGGHSEALLEAVAGLVVIGIDRDPLALQLSAERLGRFGERVRLMHGCFGDLQSLVHSAGFDAVDGVVADLGVSSMQLGQAERGMSFRIEGPLDMRMDPSSGETALELIERLDQDELANVLYRFGEERRSRRVARCIKQALAEGRLTNTLELRRAVVRAVGPARVGGVDPATRTFQALRIAVNAELQELTRLLEVAPSVVRPGGVLAVISFHSLEDRLVKRAFQTRELWTPLFKKPLLPGASELRANPRAKSAKLRAACRVGLDAMRQEADS